MMNPPWGTIKSVRISILSIIRIEVPDPMHQSSGNSAE